MLRIVPHTVPRVGRSYEHFPDGFELHLLQQDYMKQHAMGFLPRPVTDVTVEALENPGDQP